MQGEYRAQITVRPGVFKTAGAIECMELPVRLNDTHVNFTRADGVQVVDGTTGWIQQNSGCHYPYGFLFTSRQMAPPVG